jgi:hypothetical protein
MYTYTHNGNSKVGVYKGGERSNWNATWCPIIKCVVLCYHVIMGCPIIDCSFMLYTTKVGNLKLSCGLSFCPSWPLPMREKVRKVKGAKSHSLSLYGSQRQSQKNPLAKGCDILKAVRGPSILKLSTNSQALQSIRYYGYVDLMWSLLLIGHLYLSPT